MKKLLLLSLTTATLLATDKTSVIFMIGDGMGPTYTSTYRYYKDDNSTQKMDATVFDSLFIGMNTTYSDNSLITDSAAAATALATGYKTNNGFIGIMDQNTTQKQTVLEYAKENGYLTAMAVTSTLTHATPAAFLSNGHHRDDEAEIAKDYLSLTKSGKLKFDFLMGGGEKYFLEAFSDFNARAKKESLTLYRNDYDFTNIKNYPFIAFTAYDYPAFALDENKENRFRVAKMTNKALSLLDNKDFFLMIESSQIDWCGHLNDIACTMAEMEDFSRSVTLAKAYVDKHPNTLLIVTADHSTGGLAIGDKIDKKDDTISDEIKSRSYIWYKESIQHIDSSSISIAKDLNTSKDINVTFKKQTGITLKNHEYKKLKSTIALNKIKVLWHEVNVIINRHSNTGWTTHGHNAVDVETFAYGKDSEKFKGFMDNTDIAKKIFEVLGRKSKK
ncbi:MAG: alkaline phosphatase [Sulfurovum sp.]|nr:alkaline phosphatase [Sulfurovum sp.]